ncbi:hypothetical protein KGQ34_02610 [Patescibacteria group bacterium]|nr:hypothetical protein [Patescibacteria group bacterium]
MHTETYQIYTRLQKELDELISRELGYSPAAQKVKNLMRELWPELSKTEREELNKELRLPDGRMKEKIKVSGVLCPYFETGCEGIVWSVIKDGKESYDNLYTIRQGDLFTVYGENDEILFDGEIICDFQAGWTAYPNDPFGHGQPSALGYWIHWTQHGWQPDDWAKLFFHEYMEGTTNGKPLRAELVTYKRYHKHYNS